MKSNENRPTAPGKQNSASAVSDSVESTRQEELKPCPFCGCDKATLLLPTCRPETPYNAVDRLYPVVRCSQCHVDVPGNNEDYKGRSAIIRWNTRAPSVGGAQQTQQTSGEKEAATANTRVLQNDREAELVTRIAELEGKLNAPELLSFREGVVLEAAHQRERWGSDHDAGKEPQDWSLNAPKSDGGSGFLREALQELLDNALIQRGGNDDPLICYDRASFIARLREVLSAPSDRSARQATEREQDIEKAVEAEQARWQTAIDKVIHENAPNANIDGGGCESGDPLDGTIAEIGQAFAYWDNRAFDALQEMGLSSDGYPCALEALIDIFPNDSVDVDTDGQREAIRKLREQLRSATGATERARELAIRALTKQNPRFALYRDQDPNFREDDVKFWTGQFAAAMGSDAPALSLDR